MNIKYCLIIVSILVTGCGAYIDAQDYKTIETICNNNGGLKIGILSNITDGFDVYHCNDGAKFEVKSHDTRRLD